MSNAAKFGIPGTGDDGKGYAYNESGDSWALAARQTPISGQALSDVGVPEQDDLILLQDASASNALKTASFSKFDHLLGRRFKSGLYYPPGASGQDTTLTLVANIMYAGRFPIGATTAFDRAGAEVTTNQASGVLRLGLYSDAGGGGYPGALLVDWSSSGGTLDASTTGWKEYTISDSLQPGVYWLVVVAQGASGVAIRGRNGADPFVGHSSTGTQTNGGFASTTTVSGALPDPFPFSGTIGCPKAMLRAT